MEIEFCNRFIVNLQLVYVGTYYQDIAVQHWRLDARPRKPRRLKLLTLGLVGHISCRMTYFANSQSSRASKIQVFGGTTLVAATTTTTHQAPPLKVLQNLLFLAPFPTAKCFFHAKRTQLLRKHSTSAPSNFTIMAEAISGIAGGLQGSVGGMLNQGSAWLDSIFPPEKRNELMAKISKFATEKPMLAVSSIILFLLPHDHKC